MSSGYFTVKEEIENIIVIERSKFICNIKSVVDETDAKKYIEMLRKRHSLANHSCYAYIADDKGLIQKFSDAGEPQGTAGLPMLEVLKNRKIYKTVAVVTRYFGGIKLGTGGLTRAYGGSVLECLDKALIADMQEAAVYKTTLDYEGYSRLLKCLSDKNVSVLSTDFGNSVEVCYAVKSNYKETFTEKLINTFNGKIDLVFCRAEYHDFG